VDTPLKLTIYHANQCDRKRCTGLKLKRHGYVRVVTQARFLPRRSVVLNPFSEIAFSPADRQHVENYGLAALDCSWAHAEKVLMKRVTRTSRCLPILMAGNPVNFSKATMLSTVEALAGALYIAGFKQEARELMSIFVWGHTFLELNSELLEKYASARDSTEIIEMQRSLTRGSNTP